MLPSPPLTDPDERISRIRFFAGELRSGDVVPVDDQGWRQGVPREHGSEGGHGRLLWRPRRVSHFLHILTSWWWYHLIRRQLPDMP